MCSGLRQGPHRKAASAFPAHRRRHLPDCSFAIPIVRCESAPGFTVHGCNARLHCNAMRRAVCNRSCSCFVFPPGISADAFPPLLAAGSRSPFGFSCGFLLQSLLSTVWSVFSRDNVTEQRIPSRCKALRPFSKRDICDTRRNSCYRRRDMSRTGSTFVTQDKTAGTAAVSSLLPNLSRMSRHFIP